ncbi:uncharacterized protein LOC128667114 isoform X2 [Bombina bombina]|uniref:uncharacterized protein LOC128667114 isoform X2 n=1 Tax=Bombina bombina TaxID=8345 RepID=UPI00235AB04D|nr:uncharacterized protein LOC128667114 isoform X2 [Bombina bombina]
MNRHKKKMAEQFLNHALGIIYLLTGEEYTIVKKNSSRSSIHRLTGEVPIKCDDVAVYFSMDEWEFIEGQNEMYKDTMKENRPLKTVGAESSDLTGHCCENVQAEEEEREKLPQGETHSDLCTDLTGECENLQTEEEERNEIPQMEKHSGLCTGEDTDVLNTGQHEDLCARSPQEISDSIDPGSIIARANSTMGPRGSNRPRQHLTRGSASVAESVTVRPRPVLSSVSVGEVAGSQQHNLVMHKDKEPVRGDIQEFQENLFTVLVKEESEDSQQTENHSDLYADLEGHL